MSNKALKNFNIQVYLHKDSLKTVNKSFYFVYNALIEHNFRQQAVDLFQSGLLNYLFHQSQRLRQRVARHEQRAHHALHAQQGALCLGDAVGAGFEPGGRFRKGLLPDAAPEGLRDIPVAECLLSPGAEYQLCERQ